MRWILALVVLAALGAGAWLLLGSERDGGGGLEDVGARAEAEDEGGPVLSGAGDAGGRRLPAGPSGRCAIECRVTRDGKPAVAQVEAVRTGPVDPFAPGGFRYGSWTLKQFAAEPPPESSATASSDASGRAVLGGLAPGSYRVVARGPEGTRGVAYAPLAVEGARAVAVLELVPAGLVLEARVTWSDGRRPAGTLVLTSRSEGRGPWYAGVAYSAAETLRGPIGEDGHARIEGLVAGTYDVRAIFGDLVVTGTPAALPAKGTYTLAVEAPGSRVEGRVVEVPGETAVAGATVVAQGTMDERWTLQWFARATTDADGRFALVLPRPQGSLVVEAQGFAASWRQFTPTEGELVVRLVRTARVSGRVLAADGSPAAGAVVVATNASTSGRAQPMKVTATADRDGRYALDGVTPGEAQVVVRGGGWVSPGLADVQPGGFNPFVQKVPAAGALALDLQATKAASLLGAALDAQGAPVAGATVTARADSARGRWGGPSSLSDGSEGTATTDANGAFAFDNLAPGGSYRLRAEAPDQPTAQAGPFAVTAEARATVEVRFAAPRYVDVLVLFEGEDAPVAGARVTAFVSSTNTQSYVAITDAEGRARVGPCGEGQLQLNAWGPTIVNRGQSTPVEGSAGGPGPFSVTLRVPRGHAIEGQVLKADGSPAAGATVQPEMRGRGYLEEVVVGGDGTFRVTGLPSGEQTLRATWSGPAGLRLTGRATAKAGDTGISITLGASDAKPLDTFRIHVLDDAGAAVATAQAMLAYEGGGQGIDVSDGWGSLQANVAADQTLGRALAQGKAFVDVSDARGADGSRLPVGPVRVGPLARDQRDVEVRLPPERTIEGRVVAEGGGRLAGVLVTANAVGKNTWAQARSDAQGRFRLGGLGEGDYSVSVAPAPEFVSVPTSVVASGTQDHVVRLKLGVAARVRVLDHAGKPVGGAMVTAAPPPAAPTGGAPRGVPMPAPSMPGSGPEEWVLDGRGGWSARGGGNTTTEDGVVVLRGLDGDVQLTLRVNGPGSRDDLRPFRQERWTPADTDVRLERGYLIAGTVRDAAGNAVEGARVERKVGESWQGVGTDSRTGTFRITGLEPGPVVLRALGPGARRRETEGVPEVTVHAGAENVVLVVDPGLKLTVRVSNLRDRAEAGRHNLQATLLRWHDGTWQHADRGWDREGNGTVVFVGLKPETRYAVWVPPQGDDLYGWAADVKAGEVTVRLERGGSIKGRVTASAGVTPGGNVSASNDSGMSVSAQVDAAGRYEVKGLPDGRWTLTAFQIVDGKMFRGTGEAATGGTADLTLAQQGEAMPMPGVAPTPPPPPILR